MDPAEEGRVASDVGRAQRAASVSSREGAQKV
jgi:hypothetical protein